MTPIATDGKTLRRVLLVYNTDYDEELKKDSPIDVSAVQVAAMAVCRAVVDYGLECEPMGLQGVDLGRLCDRLQRDPPDLVFNLCESLNGDTRNEMVVPAVLDMLRVPYTGPGPIAIATCLDKDRAKQVLLQHGVGTPAHVVVTDMAQLDDPAHPFGPGGGRERGAGAAAGTRLEHAQFVKLLREDASIGIEASNLVTEREALCQRVGELMREHRQPILVERYVDGREVNVTVLGNGAGARVLPLHEIDFGRMPAGRPKVLTYAAKWDENHVDYIGTVPVPMTDVPPDVVAAIERVALTSFHALGLRDYGRVDLRLDGAGRPWVIDVNPNCDLSPDAGLPRTARSIGLDYPHIIGRICELAWKRHVTDHPRTQAR
jgi:D-alanine-D-alanine ligase